jgi:hypothetical protein
MACKPVAARERWPTAQGEFCKRDCSSVAAGLPNHTQAM